MYDPTRVCQYRRAWASPSVVVALSCAVLAACGSGAERLTSAPVAADTTNLLLKVVDGAAQRGFPGELLSSAIYFQVVGTGGHAVPGRRRLRVLLQPDAGTVSDTSIVTSDNGMAGVYWRLGNTPGYRTLTAKIDNGSQGAEVLVSAEIVSPDSADVVVVRGLTSGDTHVVIREGFFSWVHVLQWPDTVLHLLPHAPRADGPGGIPSWQEVTAFNAGHPPSTALAPWTDARDVVHLQMRAPVAVPVTVWVTHHFEETSARASYDLGNLNAVWRQAGLRVGTVRMEDAPDMQGLGRCADVPPRADPDGLNVYYVDRQIEGRPAYQCSPSRVLMGMNTVWSYSPIYSTLLAHEVGHAMSLSHVADASNVMTGSTVLAGFHFTVGQIYRMHFDAYGTLPAILRVNTAYTRNCQSWISQCPAEAFDPW